ncbi:MAG: serine hydrolase [Chloroflexota bacterium]
MNIRKTTSLVIIILSFALLSSFGIVNAQDPVEDTQPVIEYILENPDSVAIFCEIDGQPESTVTLNADEAFPLASTFKTIVLAEMGRQVTTGDIDPMTMVALADVNQYWLEGTDGNAHAEWLASLENADDEDAMVTLAEVAYGMIANSSNANTDYLLEEHLGYEGFAELYEALELENTSLIQGTLLGLFLVLDNPETGQADLETLDDETMLAEGERLQDLYVTDEDWRADMLDHVGTVTGEDSLAFYNRQLNYFAVYGPMSSASDISTLMGAIYAEDSELFSAEAQTFMQDTLNWIFDVNPANEDVFIQLGHKGGSLAGILTGTWYVETIGLPTIRLTVLYRDLSPEIWSGWQTTGAAELLQLRTFAFGEGCAPFGEAVEE